jgi:glycosyltransferase involved in cell wall biosynthesis
VPRAVESLSRPVTPEPGRFAAMARREGPPAAAEAQAPGLLMIGNFLSGSGGTRGVCEELAARLSAGGWKVVTASSRPGRLARLLDMLVTVVGRRRDYRVAQVDVYSGAAFLWAELTCALLRLLGKPYVLTLHGGNLPAMARSRPRRVRRLLSSARAVTSPSGYLSESLEWVRSDVQVLPNALDVSRYPFRLRSAPQPRLVWLRAFHGLYRPVRAAEVLAIVRERFPEARLTMIGPDKGDGSLAATREAAGKLGVLDRIDFPGAVPKADVPRWLGEGDVFLNTTSVDNTPVSVLEAMACGLCVVSTDVGGLPHVVTHESDGLLVGGEDAQGMAAAVQRVLSDPALAERLSRNARARAQARDWSVVLPRWESLLRSAAWK